MNSSDENLKPIDELKSILDKKPLSPPRLWFWGLILFWVALDQTTKIWAFESLRPFGSQVLIQGFWNWIYVENSGIAFGFLQGHNTILALLVILILILAFMIARDFDWRKTEVNLVGSMIIGGALGNGIDRFTRGFVIDFIDWYHQNWHWPAFNIADTLICISVGWILLRQWRK